MSSQQEAQHHHHQLILRLSPVSILVNWLILIVHPPSSRRLPAGGSHSCSQIWVFYAAITSHIPSRHFQVDVDTSLPWLCCHLLSKKQPPTIATGEYKAKKWINYLSLLVFNAPTPSFCCCCCWFFMLTVLQKEEKKKNGGKFSVFLLYTLASLMHDRSITCFH